MRISTRAIRTSSTSSGEQTLKELADEVMQFSGVDDYSDANIDRYAKLLNAAVKREAAVLQKQLDDLRTLHAKVLTNLLNYGSKPLNVRTPKKKKVV